MRGGGEDRQERQNISLLSFQQIHSYSRTKSIPNTYASVFLLVARNVIINVTTNTERNLTVQQFNRTSIMKWTFLDSKNSVISRLGALIPVPASSILLNCEARESEMIHFHVSVIIVFAWSAVHSVLHADKRRQWSYFSADDKPLFVIIAPRILCAQGICPALFLPLLILSLWVSIVCSTYFNWRMQGMQEKYVGIRPRIKEETTRIRRKHANGYGN